MESSSESSWSSHDEYSPEIPCSFQGCKLVFRSEKALKRHKINDDDHDYCETCDMDFVDWDAWVAHKASSPQHLSCERCGMDFKVVKALEQHLNSHHPMEQSLDCLGCPQHFKTAAAYMYHIEMEPCAIMAGKLEGHVLHKKVVTAIMASKNPGAYFNRGDWDNDEGTPNIKPFGPESDGGVTLPQIELLKPTPVVDVKSWLETMPSAQDEAEDDSDDEIIDKMRAPSPVKETKAVLSPHARAAAKGKPQAFEKMILNISLSEKAKQFEATDGKFEPKDPPPQNSDKASATYQKLPKTDGKAFFAANTKEAGIKADNGKMIFSRRFWDPRSKDYVPDIFFHPLFEVYQCPFPMCPTKETDLFRLPRQLDAHITSQHRHRSTQCPMCLNNFAHTYALVAHWEADRAKCKGDGDSAWFNKQVSIFTGGFLQATMSSRGQCPPVPYMKWTQDKPVDWVDGRLMNVYRRYDEDGHQAEQVERPVGENPLGESQAEGSANAFGR